MSEKGHVQPRMKKDKDHAIVGRQDYRLIERQQEHEDPIKRQPRRQSLRLAPKS